MLIMFECISKTCKLLGVMAKCELLGRGSSTVKEEKRFIWAGSEFFESVEAVAF